MTEINGMKIEFYAGSYNAKKWSKPKSLKQLIPDLKSFKGDRKNICHISFKNAGTHEICLTESLIGKNVLASSDTWNKRNPISHINLTGDTTVFDKFWHPKYLEDLGRIYGQYNIEDHLNDKTQICLGKENKVIPTGFDVDSWGGGLISNFGESGDKVKGLRKKEKERRNR